MNRTGLALSAVLATVGAAKVLFPGAVATLFALDTEVAIFALAIAVLAYGVWFGPLKFMSGSKFLHLTGLSIFLAGLISISSPTLWGLRDSFVPIADIFLVIETGIMLQLIGLEQKVTNAVTPMAYAGLIWLALQRRFHRGHSQAPVGNYISQ